MAPYAEASKFEGDQSHHSGQWSYPNEVSALGYGAEHDQPSTGYRNAYAVNPQVSNQTWNPSIS
ncbi:hypothetical protein N7540_012887 [Penicillium herquei]|nr:hypothetical protein N7540_012887 [Penicillium herquei]